MANLNALIAQGAQFDLPNPVDQYSKVMQLQSAQQQMQLNRQQMQQIQEDRAGFTKLRAALAQKNLTPEQYRLALIDSPDPKMQQMGIELGLRQTRLDDLDRDLEKARGGGVEPPIAPAKAPMATPAEVPMAAPAVVAPGVPYNSFGQTGKYRYDKNLSAANIFELQKKSKQGSIELEPNQYWSQDQNGQLIVKAVPPVVDNALAAQVAPAAPVANALVAQPPAAAPVGNAMASKQARIAQINKDLATLTKPQYYDLDGVKGRIANLDRELKQLTESPVGKVDLDKFDPASVAKFLDSGNFADLKRTETATGGRYLSLGAGRALDQETGQIISADRVPVTATAVAAQPQAAPKITNIKGVPYTFDADTGKFIRVPVEGGLPAAAGKGGTGKQATASKPKPPSGYRYDASGENLEPIPGGPASEKLQPKEIQKREALRPQATQALKTVNNTMSIIGQTVDRLLANSKGINGITGLIGGVTPALTNEARAAKADLEQLKNLAFIQGLTELRAASKTGAGVGNVSNREGDRFENLKASLDRSQSKEDLEASLRRLKAQSEFTIQAMQEAFDSTYSYKAAAGSAPAANVDDLLDKYK